MRSDSGHHRRGLVTLLAHVRVMKRESTNALMKKKMRELQKAGRDSRRHMVLVRLSPLLFSKSADGQSVLEFSPSKEFLYVEMIRIGNK
jgi:hypothetical protein